MTEEKEKKLEDFRQRLLMGAQLSSEDEKELIELLDEASAEEMSKGTNTPQTSIVKEPGVFVNLRKETVPIGTVALRSHHCLVYKENNKLMAAGEKPILYHKTAYVVAERLAESENCRIVRADKAIAALKKLSIYSPTVVVIKIKNPDKPIKELPKYGTS